MNITQFKYIVKHNLLFIRDKLYPHTLLVGVLLSFLSSCYLIYDHGVVNSSALSLLWSLTDGHIGGVASNNTVLAHAIQLLQTTLGIASPELAGYSLMVIVHALLTLLIVLISRQLSFSLLTQWALLFLFLSHPSYDDFRTYIISEPLFWLMWLTAFYLLILFYRRHTVFAILQWLVILVLASFIDVAAWFWLLLFPFGALFWHPWRRRSVLYALLGYAAIVGLLLFLPIYQGVSPFDWLVKTIFSSPEYLYEALSLGNNNWVEKDNYFMAGVFVFSGAISLVIIRTLILLNILCLLMAVYAILRRQYRVMNEDVFRILIYAIGFDVFISVVRLILGEDNTSILSFSTVLLLLFFSALGLSYTFKKMQARRFSDLTILVIVWCCVAYFASAFIIFGPRRDYLRVAGETFAQSYPEAVFYSERRLVLFYSGRNPDITHTLEDAEINALANQRPVYYGHYKHRRVDLPTVLADREPVMLFSNRRGDTFYIYRIMP
ncbi:MAG: hypothetical protein CSA45_03290 [Gammaproteobacteria bacterium]|nr:MAG: hypothetical protein CSA45_03290 [Gammaproteobacteria bacterium]